MTRFSWWSGWPYVGCILALVWTFVRFHQFMLHHEWMEAAFAAASFAAWWWVANQVARRYDRRKAQR